jgi:cytochrome c553
MDTRARILLLPVIFCALYFPSTSSHADMLVRAQLIAASCNLCHGTDCMGALAIPRINGVMSADDFMFKMNGFYFGDETATVMGRIARGLNPEELQQLAYYFSKIDRSR